eukprot:9433336-Karenia_brevis.AAC.1
MVGASAQNRRIGTRRHRAWAHACCDVRIAVAHGQNLGHRSLSITRLRSISHDVPVCAIPDQ